MWQIKAQINGCASTRMVHMLSSDDSDMLQIKTQYSVYVSILIILRMALTLLSVSHTHSAYIYKNIWVEILWAHSCCKCAHGHVLVGEESFKRERNWGEKDGCTFKITQQSHHYETSSAHVSKCHDAFYLYLLSKMTFCTQYSNMMISINNIHMTKQDSGFYRSLSR